MAKYEDIYDYDNYEEVAEAIDEMRGTIGRGDCLYCHGKLTMEYVGDICFICSRCGKSVHEDVYYTWAAGYNVELDD